MMNKETAPPTPDLITPLFRREDLSDYRRRLIRISAWVYFLSLGLIFSVSTALPPGQVYWPVVYFILATGFPAALTLAFSSWPRRHPEWLLGISVYSIIKIGVLISVTGGDQSPFFPLYLFVLILSAAFFTGRSFMAVVFSMMAVFTISEFFNNAWRLDLNHFLSLPVYIVTALITNYLLRDFHRRSDQAWRQAGQLEGLYEASRLLYAESAAQPPFDILLEIARRGVDAKRGAIYISDGPGEIAAFHQTRLTPAQSDLFKDLSIADADLETLFSPDTPSTDVGLSPAQERPIVIPLHLREVQIGRIYFADKFGGLAFTKEDEAMVAALARDITLAIERIYLRKKIEALAVTDGLTGLYNHRALIDQIRGEIERASRYGHSCALLMSDIDSFKGINDSHGHPMGDAALKEVARVIRQIGRRLNFPARYGGDEFAVLLPETDKKAALLVAERYRNGTAGLSIPTPEGAPITLSVSVGVASYPEDASDPESLIRAADAALYQAKRLGKNRVAS